MPSTWPWRTILPRGRTAEVELVGTVGGTEIFIHRGDISRVEADALVNAANNHLWMGAGVAGALKRAGGQELEREAVARGPIGIGEAVSTTAGNLPAKRVIHAAVMGQDLRTSAELIRRATTAALAVAQTEHLASIALPAFGTGVGAFPKTEAARQMVGATMDFLDPGDAGLERVIFVLYDDATARIFADELSRRLEAV